MLTNRSRSFQDTKTVETGLSDHHKMTITTLKSIFKNETSCFIIYRSYKHFDLNDFQDDLDSHMNDIPESKINYENFQSIFMQQLDKHAPMKKKVVRANNAPFMNKILSKAIMNRSRLRNRYLKKQSIDNERAYKKQRNYCVTLIRREKKKYYENMNIKSITDNKKFWNTVKPLFSEKDINNKKIVLLEGNDIQSDDKIVAETMNDFFSHAVLQLNIEGYITNDNILVENDLKTP